MRLPANETILGSGGRGTPSLCDARTQALCETTPRYARGRTSRKEAPCAFLVLDLAGWGEPSSPIAIVGEDVAGEGLNGKKPAVTPEGNSENSCTPQPPPCFPNWKLLHPKRGLHPPWKLPRCLLTFPAQSFPQQHEEAACFRVTFPVRRGSVRSRLLEERCKCWREHDAGDNMMHPCLSAEGVPVHAETTTMYKLHWVTVVPFMA